MNFRIFPMWLVIILPTLFSVNIIPLKQPKAVGKIPMDGREKNSQQIAAWGPQTRDPYPWVLSDSQNVLQGVFI